MTVDIDGHNWRETVASGGVPENLLQRITFFESDSVSDELIRKISSITAGKKTLVILDSSHTAAHVLRELQLYSKMVTPGSYLIANDTHLEGIGLDSTKPVESDLPSRIGNWSIDCGTPIHWFDH